MIETGIKRKRGKGEEIDVASRSAGKKLPLIIVVDSAKKRGKETSEKYRRLPQIRPPMRR